MNSHEGILSPLFRMAIWKPGNIHFEKGVEYLKICRICFIAIFPKGCCRIVWSFELSRKKWVFQDLSNSFCQSLKTRTWTEQLEKRELHGGWWNLICFREGRCTPCPLIWRHINPLRTNHWFFTFLSANSKSQGQTLVQGSVAGKTYFLGKGCLDLTGAHSQIWFKRKNSTNVKTSSMVKEKHAKKGYPLKSFAFIRIFCSDLRISCCSYVKESSSPKASVTVRCGTHRQNQRLGTPKLMTAQLW